MPFLSTAILCSGLTLTLIGKGWAQNVVITEFLALNNSSITDEDGDSSDWIELQNQDTSTVDLAGWFLTDDPEIFNWRFPATVLPPGEFLVVFASRKNRAEPGRELHTDFRLSGDGEYLALGMPDGTVVHEFAPYPPQREDVAYGILQDVTRTTLVSAGAAMRVRVPSNGDDGLDWTLPDHVDTSWQAGTTGVGFDTDGGVVVPPEDAPNLALGGTATQSTIGFGGVPSRAIDGNTDPNYGGGSITHTATGDSSPWWELELEESATLDRIVLWNRADCCTERLSNFRVRVLDDAREQVFADDFFTAGGFPAAGVGFEIPLPQARRGHYVRVELLGPNTNNERYLSLVEVQVFERVILGFGELIGTDLKGSMLGSNASAYLRVPFDVADPVTLEVLKLRMKYDDGFVAYLNGREVARQNAPASPLWNSSATSERSDEEAVLFQEVNISEHLDALMAGSNVVAIHGLNLSNDDPDFLILPELEDSSVVGDELRYLPEPTPGAANDTRGIVGFVVDTKFSVDRGFYDTPFQVEITTETPGSEIRYTTNGSEPSETRGTIYRGPINVSSTTVIRAIAYKSGLEPTNVDTHTYIYLDQVIASGVMDRSITQSATYGPQMRAALTDLPTVSLVTSGSINNNAEVRTSIEWILPDGSPGFQEDAGVKYYGGAFTNFAKKNFRFYFRSEYGARKLRFPLFAGQDRGIPAVNVFDQLELRGGAHDMNQRGFYMSNRFTDDTMLDMGNLNPHGRFVHLYIDATYWGQYHLRERWNADMLAQYLGGDKEDYEAINGNWNVGGWADPGVPYDGDGSAWTRIKSLRDDYEAVKPYLDVPHYVDFMLMFMFGNSEDEYRCVGPTGPGSGFKFFLNDADGFTRTVGNRTAMGQPGRRNGDGPGSIFSMLLAEGHPDYKTLLADRIHKHFFNDGAMTPAKNRARLLERCSQVERAFIAEAARWGYRTPASWESAKNAYVNNVLPSRTATVINQYRAAGFYSATAAPVFDQHGGAIEPGFSLRLLRTAGQILYTLDGTDPRLPGGAVSPAALESGVTDRSTLLRSEAPVRVLVPTNGSLGLDWIAPDFDDSGWQLGTTGVGYEATTGYEDLINTDLQDQLHRVNASLYLRLEFEVDNLAGVDFLTLRMKYDDGFVAYLNGQRVASANALQQPLWNSVATASNSDSRAVVFEDFDISEAVDSLRAGRNVLAIHGLNQNTTSSDMLILPEVTASQASGEEIILNRTTRVRARTRLDSTWSALNEAVFVVDSSSLRITELMYNPPPGEPGSAYDNDQYEYVELQNTGDAPLNLMEIRFSSGIEFTFPELSPEADLAPGEFVLIVRNLEAFESRYVTEGLYIAGEYDGALSNGGELIVLRDALGRILLDFVYSDAWYPFTDGAGHSLEIVDARAAPESWRQSESWRASRVVGGTPGEGESVGGELQLPGNINQDGNLDISDAIALLLHLFAGTPEVLPCEGGTISDEGNRLLLDSNGDARVDLTDAINVLRYLFQGGAPPVLGTDCVRIVGCPDACVR